MEACPPDFTLFARSGRSNPNHERCVETLSSLTAPVVTTWPAFTEAVSSLGSAGGWKAQQEALWKLLDRGDLQLVPLDDAVQDRTQALTAKYRDRPMDLANATLAAAAEALGLNRVFTLDRDFQVYRWRGKRKFEVVP